MPDYLNESDTKLLYDMRDLLSQIHWQLRMANKDVYGNSLSNAKRDAALERIRKMAGDGTTAQYWWRGA